MKVSFPALLLPMLLGATACAKSEPVRADPDEVEAAVKEANGQATVTREAPRAGE